jgi:hypothetical protein
VTALRPIGVHIAQIQTSYFTKARFWSDFYGYSFATFTEEEAFTACERYIASQLAGLEFVATIRPICPCINAPRTPTGRRKRCKACGGKPLPVSAEWHGFEAKKLPRNEAEAAIVRVYTAA